MGKLATPGVGAYQVCGDGLLLVSHTDILSFVLLSSLVESRTESE